MIKCRTVGELSAALAQLPEDAPLNLSYEAGCCGSSWVVVRGLSRGAAILDVDDDSEVVMSGGRPMWPDLNPVSC